MYLLCVCQFYVYSIPIFVIIFHLFSILSYITLTCFCHIIGEVNSNSLEHEESEANHDIGGKSSTEVVITPQVEGAYKQPRKRMRRVMDLIR